MKGLINSGFRASKDNTAFSYIGAIAFFVAIEEKGWENCTWSKEFVDLLEKNASTEELERLTEIVEKSLNLA